MLVLSGDPIPHIYIPRSVMFGCCLFRLGQLKRNSVLKNKVWGRMQNYAKFECFGQLARNIDYIKYSEELDIGDYALGQLKCQRRVPNVPYSSLNKWHAETSDICNKRWENYRNGTTLTQEDTHIEIKSKCGVLQKNDSNQCTIMSTNGFDSLNIKEVESSKSGDKINVSMPSDSEILHIFSSDGKATKQTDEVYEVPLDTEHVPHSLPSPYSSNDGEQLSCDKICAADVSDISGNPRPQSMEKMDVGSIKTLHSNNSQTDNSPTNTSQKGIFLSKVDGKKSPVDNNLAVDREQIRAKICALYDKVLIVDNITLARQTVRKLTSEYNHLVHACDTEVANIDVKRETPVSHGDIICFSIYSGPDVDLGDGKCCVWVDVLDGGGRDIVQEFAPFFENSSIKKVWHNYSFDAHILENHGLKLSGFHADTMHMARLWNPSRLINEGGYSMEALTNDAKIFSAFKNIDPNYDKMGLIGKVTMKVLFGIKKVKKNGMPGKITVVPPVKDLQLNDRKQWICYSALDAVNTLLLYKFFWNRLSKIPWYLEGVIKGSMLEFYFEYWMPFGNLLVEMETEGMLVDREYLSEIEKVALTDKQVCSDIFRNWASLYCHDAKYMNVGSDTQIRTLFFGGSINRKNHTQPVPTEKTFKVPNVDGVLEADSKKTVSKFRTIKLKTIVEDMKSPQHTISGWPSVSNDALKALSGKVSAECDIENDFEENNNLKSQKKDAQKVEKTTYGTAYASFGRGKNGARACRAISALSEVSSIDSLVSNFILPLQGSDILGKTGRIHCSLNINTETGRLSARKPNLQNQPAFEKDRYKIRQAFIAAPGNSLIVADYGQLELRLLAHLADCKSMLDAFKAGGDFHSRTALNMYFHIRDAVNLGEVIMEWDPTLGSDKPPVPLLKDAFAAERRRAKMLNFSIAYGKTPAGLARDWKVSVKEAQETVDLWYKDRKEVLTWQDHRKAEVEKEKGVKTLLGRCRCFPSISTASSYQRGHIERSAINTPVQGSAADVAMCAMLQISRNLKLKELGWKLLLQIHDEVILEGPTESSETAKAIVIECMTKPFDGQNILRVGLSVDAKCAQNWYLAK